MKLEHPFGCADVDASRLGLPGDVMLACVDESLPYEVDQCAILKRGEKFILALATGCSCWDGGWDEEEFATFTDLRASFIKDDRQYNPSLSLALRMIEEAEAELP